MNCILQKVKRKKKCRTHSFSNLFLSFINPHIFSSNSLNWTWYLHKGHVALLLCQFTIQLEWNLCTYLSILPSSPTFVSFWQTPQTAPSFLNHHILRSLKHRVHNLVVKVSNLMLCNVNGPNFPEYILGSYES